MKYCAEPPKIITNMKSFEQRSSDETVYVGSNGYLAEKKLLELTFYLHLEIHLFVFLR